VKSLSRRHHLTCRQADKLTPARAAVSKDEITEYFRHLPKELEGKIYFNS